METLQVEAQRFFGNTANRGHADRTVWSQPLEQITGGLRSGREIAEQALGLVAGSGLSALDVGCSYGPIVFGLAASERVAEVVGLDVEDAALALGRAIAGSDLVGSAEGAKCQFVSGQSEQMPFPPDTFDLIVCNTVIEHVYDVEATLRDMMRVLKPGGVLYLCAPNYLWPYEPHLKIWMPPLGPKGVAKLVARCAPGRDPRFIDHLNFVSATGMERLFRKQGLVYRNLYLDKLARILV
ncbi:MAG TPA: class I SAM-dependent methyltransferase, partial [Chthonomonadaceae bacterium]|nr:class I SAM-dependent methyltransferase [Chthonomonadaceae bacterium]